MKSDQLTLLLHDGVEVDLVGHSLAHRATRAETFLEVVPEVV